MEAAEGVVDVVEDAEVVEEEVEDLEAVEEVGVEDSVEGVDLIGVVVVAEEGAEGEEGEDIEKVNCLLMYISIMYINLSIFIFFQMNNEVGYSDNQIPVTIGKGKLNISLAVAHKLTRVLIKDLLCHSLK